MHNRTAKPRNKPANMTMTPFRNREPVIFSSVTGGKIGFDDPWLFEHKSSWLE